MREVEQSRPRRRRRHRIAACLGLVPRIVCMARASVRERLVALGVDAVDMRAWCRDRPTSSWTLLYGRGARPTFGHFVNSVCLTVKNIDLREK